VAPNPWGTGARAPSHFYKWLGTGGTVSRRTATNKLAKLYITKALTKTTNCIFRAKKAEGHDHKNFFSGASRRTGSPHFRAGLVPPLSNSFRRHRVEHSISKMN